jgi:hypothetical protein
LFSINEQKQEPSRTFAAVWSAADLQPYSGCYNLKLLSLYDHVANFQVSGWPHLFFIGDQHLARGPASIGLSTADFGSFKNLLQRSDSARIEQGRVIFNSPKATMIIDRREGEQKSFAPVFSPGINEMIIRPTLEYYLAILKGLIINSPSAVLLNCPGGEEYFRQVIADHFPALIKALIEQNKQEIMKYCRNICGMGHGLTPTGDDLIHAAFVVTSCYGQNGKLLMDSLKTEVDLLSAQTGFFGRHMIEIGRRSLTPEPFLKFLEAINSGFKAPEIVEQMISVGSATGYDLAVGLSVTLTKYFDSGLMLDR